MVSLSKLVRSSLRSSRKSRCRKNLCHQDNSVEHLEVRSLLAVTLVPEQAIWQNDGPSPIYSFPVVSGTGATIQANGIASNAGQFSGAIQTIAAHPTDANTIYVGGVNGGVWQTTDGGTNWTALTDNLPSLAIV